MIFNSKGGGGGIGEYIWAKYQYQKDTRLPAGYARLTSISSSGTQYIDTGYVPSSQNFRVVYDFELPSGTTSGYLFGGMNTTHSIIASVGGVFYVGSTGNPIPLTLSPAVRYEMDAHAESGTFTVVLNGTTEIASYSGSLDNSTPLFLFTHSKSGGVPEGSTWAAFTLYACQIFDNGALVRDFVPCYRKTDAVVGLYDLVNGVFYTNQGSGEFIKDGLLNFIEFVSSNDASKYPDNAEHTDGYYYVMVTDPYLAEQDLQRVARGTVSAQGATSGIGTSYVEITGLDFQPSYVILSRNAVAVRAILWTMGTTAFYYSSSTITTSNSSKTITVTLNPDGFHISTYASSMHNGYFNGTYYWVALAE